MLTPLKSKFRRFTSDKSFSEILTGSVWALGARVGGTVLAFATSVLVARMYGAEMMGVLAIIQSFLMLITTFTKMGTDTAVLRLIPEHVAKYSVSSAFRVYRKTQFLVTGISMLTGVVFICGASIVAENVFHKPHLAFYFALAAGFAIFKALADLNTQAVRGLRLIRTFALMQTLPQGSMMLLLLFSLLFWNNSDAPIYAQLGAWVMTALTGMWVMTSCFRKKIKTADKVQNLPLGALLRISSPMLITASMSFFIAQTGIVLLGMFVTDKEVGYYSIAVKLATLTTFVLQAINSMAAPKFAELYHAGNIDELFHIAHKSARIIFWTTAPILAVLFVFGSPILGLFFGTEFRTASPALMVLVVGQFVNAASGSTGYFMNMTGRHKAFSYIIGFAAVLNIALGFLLIPKWGALGSAWASSISMVFWNFAVLGYIKAIHGRGFGYLPIPRLQCKRFLH